MEKRLHTTSLFTICKNPHEGSLVNFVHDPANFFVSFEGRLSNALPAIVIFPRILLNLVGIILQYFGH